jgi:hypothetical protein
MIWLVFHIRCEPALPNTQPVASGVFSSPLEIRNYTDLDMDEIER